MLFSNRFGFGKVSHTHSSLDPNSQLTNSANSPRCTNIGHLLFNPLPNSTLPARNRILLHLRILKFLNRRPSKWLRSIAPTESTPQDGSHTCFVRCWGTMCTDCSYAICTPPEGKVEFVLLGRGGIDIGMLGVAGGGV